MKPFVMREKHPLAVAAVARWDELRTMRSQFEGDWNAIARLMRPQRGGYGLDDTGSRQHEKPLSSAPIRAQSNFAAAIYGTLTNPAAKWFTLSTGDEDLNRFPAMAEWLDICTQRVFLSFAPSTSNFYDQMMPFASDLAAFGNGAQFDESVPGKGKIMDVTISLNEVVTQVNAFGEVDEVVRRTHLTPSAIVKAYGAENVPPRILELAEKRSTDKIAVSQHVFENESWRRGAIGAGGKPWSSVHAIEEKGGWLLRHAGFDEMPFYYTRWDVETGHNYGTGPGFVALASARSHRQMTEAKLRAAQRAADPTILAPDRDAFPLRGRVTPGGVIYGGTSVRGDRMLHTLDATGRVDLTIEETRTVMQEIQDAFYVTLLNFQNRTGMTPMEIAAIEAERTRLWAPNMGRIQTEYLARKIERRFRMLWRAGQLPPPPRLDRNGEIPLLVQYTSAAALAQRAQERLAAVQWIADLAPLGQVKPRVLDRLDEDALVETLHEASGLPARLLRSREDADAIAQARAEQMQAEQAMAAAQGGAGIVKDLAQAQGAVQQDQGGQR